MLLGNGLRIRLCKEIGIDKGGGREEEEEEEGSETRGHLVMYEFGESVEKARRLVCPDRFKELTGSFD